MPLQRQLFIVTLACTVASSALADNGSKSSQISIACPEVSDLYKNPQTQRWESKPYHSYWKSYSASFLPNLNRFTGAQYIGNTQGNLACVYVGSRGSSAFPVILHFGTLVHAPKSDHGLYKWQPLRSGWANCISDLPADCPFSPIIEKKQTTTQVYDSLEHLKPSRNLADQAIKF